MSVLDTFSLSGQVSVVTGGNRGIGRALATALAEAGSDVVLLVRDRAGTATAIAELEALGVSGAGGHGRRHRRRARCSGRSTRC